MIWVTLRAAAGSGVATPTKSGIAIGSGWTLPWVTSSLSTAAARRGDRPASAPAAAPAPSMISRRRLNACQLVIEARSIMARSSRASAAVAVIRGSCRADRR